MLDRVHDIPAVWLNPRDYQSEYEREFSSAVDVVYRLERHQVVIDPENASWAAFAKGKWARTMELIDRSRPQAWAIVQRERDAGLRTRHIRVVEYPITPSVQWQMHFLRLLAKEGQEMRVLRADQLTAWEAQHPLPDTALLGSHLLYEVRYDPADHVVASARRIDDAAAVAACQADLAFLFAQGEDLPTYFDREIAHLPPPAK